MCLYHRRHRDQKYRMQSNSRKTMHKACVVYDLLRMVYAHTSQVESQQISLFCSAHCLPGITLRATLDIYGVCCTNWMHNAHSAV